MSNTPPLSASSLPSDSRNWAMAAHLSSFVGAWLFLGFVGPLVVWLIKRDNDAFAERHAREALNFGLTMLLALGLGIAFTALTFGCGALLVVPIAAVVGTYWFVASVYGAVQAANGREYRYPLTIRFL